MYKVGIIKHLNGKSHEIFAKIPMGVLTQMSVDRLQRQVEEEDLAGKPCPHCEREKKGGKKNDKKSQIH